MDEGEVQPELAGKEIDDDQAAKHQAMVQPFTLGPV